MFRDFFSPVRGEFFGKLSEQGVVLESAVKATFPSLLPQRMK
jgi:hypothetical protein